MITLSKEPPKSFMYFYSQTSGVLQQGTDETLETLGTGYAGGNCGKNPEGVNNPAMQCVVCVGPLPRGLYTIGRPQDPVTHLGPCAMPLDPGGSNVMCGRYGFFTVVASSRTTWPA